MTVEFGVLGDVQASLDDHLLDLGHDRQRCVLSALVVDCNQPVPVDRLLDRVWGDRLPQRARETVYSYLSRLRRVLADAGDVEIVRRPGGYVLSVDPLAVDLHRFQRLVSLARASDDPAQAEELLEQALRIWRGDAFGLLDTPWLATVRADLHQQRLAAELERNDLVLARGGHVELLTDLTASLAANPLDERLAGQLMLALYRCGRQAGALDVFGQVRRRLGTELGADPGPALTELNSQILRADPALLGPADRSAAGAVRGARAPVPRQLPAPPGSFTGRVQELALLSAAMDAQADQSDVVVISAIGGSGGIGKTWLALRWANDNLDRFPDGQLYTNLRGFDPASEPVPPAVAIRGFLDSLGVEPGDIPVDLEAQAGLYRSLVADKRMLIVLDNARDTAQVSPLLPGTPTCAVLVTSRHELVHLATAHGARRLALDVLSDSEAHELLVGHLGSTRIDAEPKSVNAVLEHCAGLPLALGIIAARAASHPDFPLSALADELRDAATRLDALDTGELAANLRAALACSYLALPSEVARVFVLLARAPGPDICLAALASLVDESAGRARTLLRHLVNAHLADEHEPGRYRMHDLVRLYATETAELVTSPDQLKAALQRALDHYLQTAYAAAMLLDPFRAPIALVDPLGQVAVEPLANYEDALAWFRTEHAVLLAAIDLAADQRWDVHAWQLAWTLAMYFQLGGHRRDAEATQRVALAAAERLGDFPAQAGAHRRIAISDLMFGRYDDAHEHLRRALELFEELGDLVGQANSRVDQARLLELQGRPHDAIGEARQALELFRVDGNGAGQATALNAIGWMQVQLGELDQAVDSCEQALRLTQDLGFRVGEANTWDSLGYAHHHLGHYDEASRCFEHAIDLFRVLGDRYNEASSLVRLGDTHDAAGDPDLSRATWQQALTILNDIGHRDANQLRLKITPE